MRIVVSGYHGMGNTGDEAVLEAFLQGVRKVLPQARLTVLSGDPESTERAYGVDSVSRTHLPSIVRALRDADLLVSGGGSLLQDVTGPFTVPYYTGIMLLAYLMRVPVAVYAQGLGPLRGRLSRHLARIGLSRAAVLSLRDAESVQLLRQIGIRRRDVHLVADPAFALSPQDSPEARRIGDREGVVMFALRPWDVGRDITPEYAECARRVRVELGADVVFVAFHPCADLELAKRLAELTGGATVITFDMTPGQALGVVGSAQLVVGMRLHSLIFAASAGVPAVAIEYDPKVRALCERVGTTHVLPAGVSGDVLYETIARAWSARERLRAEQVLSVDELREGARVATELALRPLLDGKGEGGARGCGEGGRRVPRRAR